MDTLKITLVGGPTALLEFGGLRVLTDPTFDPPGSYSGGAPLTKLTGPALTVGQIGKIDAVLLSHDQHFDNLDHSGKVFLSTTEVVWTTPAGARRLGSPTKGLAPWEKGYLRSKAGRMFQVVATPARHGPAGIEPISGEVTGFVICDVDGAPLIYLTGDTVWFEGLAEVARRYPVKVVILFAGAAQARGPFNLTMSTNDALEAAHYFHDAALVPIHYQGWQHFTQNQDDLVRAFATLRVPERLRVVAPGQQIQVGL